MFYFASFHTFAPIFHFKLCSFVDGEPKNISCPRAQGTLATPLFLTAFLQVSSAEAGIVLNLFLIMKFWAKKASCYYTVKLFSMNWGRGG